jgi:hypothetical protein
MRILKFLLVTSLLMATFSWADSTDTELEEKLKGVMILFEKSQQGLREEIASLELQLSYLENENTKLKTLLTQADNEILDLKTELMLKESETSTSEPASEVIVAEVIASNSNFGNAGPGQGGRGGRGQGGGGRLAGDLAPVQIPEGNLLDINSASREDLLALPLVNEFLADSIIDGRPWDTIEDLIQLQGFGPMKLRRLQPYATATPISEIPEATVSENPVD